jgi:hypothetical protein
MQREKASAPLCLPDAAEGLAALRVVVEPSWATLLEAEPPQAVASRLSPAITAAVMQRLGARFTPPMMAPPR